MLEGPIPDSLGLLSKLRYLNLANNSLSSSIPHSIWRLQNLGHLILVCLPCSLETHLVLHACTFTTQTLPMRTVFGTCAVCGLSVLHSCILFPFCSFSSLAPPPPPLCPPSFAPTAAFLVLWYPAEPCVCTCHQSSL